jgi:hypothetical protein
MVIGQYAVFLLRSYPGKVARVGKRDAKAGSVPLNVLIGLDFGTNLDAKIGAWIGLPFS